METRTPQPAKTPKPRPIRFSTVEAFTAAYMELHGQAPAPVLEVQLLTAHQHPQRKCGDSGQSRSAALSQWRAVDPISVQLATSETLGDRLPLSEVLIDQPVGQLGDASFSSSSCPSEASMVRASCRSAQA